jgi:hypothetical protein
MTDAARDRDAARALYVQLFGEPPGHEELWEGDGETIAILMTALAAARREGAQALGAIEEAVLQREELGQHPCVTLRRVRELASAALARLEARPAQEEE